jgi:hypothetical protein
VITDIRYYEFKEVGQMRKDLKHIAFYTRKVADFSRTYRNSKRNQYRSNRLMQYKAALNKRLKGGG